MEIAHVLVYARWARGHLLHNLVSSWTWLFGVGLGYQDKRDHAQFYLASTTRDLASGQEWVREQALVS